MGTKQKLKHAIRRKNDPGGEHIRREWGDVEVVDAERELRVFITPEDVAKATKKDPAGCVLARACQRVYQSTKVMFLRSVAYVELPDATGKHRVERFTMSATMRDLLESFDRGRDVIPKAGFVLRPPRPSRHLEVAVKARHESRSRQKLVGKAIVGDGIGQGKGAYRDNPIVIDLSVRDGRGAVHFKRTRIKP